MSMNNAAETTVEEIRFDIEIPAISMQDHLAILALSAKWSFRNSQLRAARFAAEAAGPTELK